MTLSNPRFAATSHAVYGVVKVSSYQQGRLNVLPDPGLKSPDLKPVKTGKQFLFVAFPAVNDGAMLPSGKPRERGNDENVSSRGLKPKPKFSSPLRGMLFCRQLIQQLFQTCQLSFYSLGESTCENHLHSFQRLVVDRDADLGRIALVDEIEIPVRAR